MTQSQHFHTTSEVLGLPSRLQRARARCAVSSLMDISTFDYTGCFVAGVLVVKEFVSWTRVGCTAHVPPAYRDTLVVPYVRCFPSNPGWRQLACYPVVIAVIVARETTNNNSITAHPTPKYFTECKMGCD